MIKKKSYVDNGHNFFLLLEKSVIEYIILI